MFFCDTSDRNFHVENFFYCRKIIDVGMNVRKAYSEAESLLTERGLEVFSQLRHILFFFSIVDEHNSPFLSCHIIVRILSTNGADGEHQ